MCRCGLDGSVRVWTADFQEQAVPEQHTGAVTCIAAHEEYVYTAGGHPYGTVHKWHCGAVTVCQCRRVEIALSMFLQQIFEACVM